ncbi:Transmembrane prolyl 4-hydroxylase [Stylophora pistillata]|uniref:Transmembrane prolyl 4-hydroxylase n=1 Tax=Stylophora pistillata TaxID=50429 RepID=A0A2B4RRQ7_STYPI|nr:Transmembrane prolyl 4-hydroxylase [Stylophora pistillata]
MAPPRADNKKFSKEKSKQKATKKPSKSSLPSTAVAVAITALAAICVAVYYKNGYGIESNLRQAMEERSKESVRASTSKRTDANTDFKVLPRLNGVKVGHVQKRQLSPGKMYVIKTLSLRPPIFEIPDFLSNDECQTMVSLASREGLDTSEVQDPETGINIEPTNEATFHSWDYNNDGVIDKVEVMHNLVDLSDLYFSEEDIAKIVASLTKLPRAAIEESEELQVVHYHPEGHYHCHHDSQDIEPNVPCCAFRDRRHCRLCRYITVLYFLNDVEEGGETAFPVADNATFSTEFRSFVILDLRFKGKVSKTSVHFSVAFAVASIVPPQDLNINSLHAVVSQSLSVVF